MTTPERQLAPKNYIVSGISKNLLTPCRRVGLSRTKKTPKDIVPKASVLQKDTTQTPVDAHNDSSIIKDVDLDTTPKLRSNPEPKKRLVRSPLNKTVKKTRCETPTHVNVVANQDVPEHLHIKSAHKLCLKEANSFNASANVLENIPLANTDETSESDSPPISPIFSDVTVQVHHPVAKRTINFNEIDSDTLIAPKDLIKPKENPLSPVSLDKKDSLTSVSTPVIANVLKEKCETNQLLAKNKKRKLRLDSDDFETIPECSEPYDKKPTNGNASGNTLTRFTTEDYLKEYSKNPKTFQECLEMGSSGTSTLNDDSDDDFMPAKLCKIKTISSEDSSEKKNKKSYKAIFLASEKSKKSFKSLSESISSRTLTVSLECINHESVKDKSHKQDHEESNCTTRENKTIVSKLTCQSGDSDDDMFTSSPDTCKKQRESLLQLIANTEKEIKRKQETLERLKQAQVYKKRHSPEKLKESSEKWMEGCKTGLKDLLMKMKEHGPMEMDTLIHNLNIPHDIVEKLHL